MIALNNGCAIKFDYREYPLSNYYSLWEFDINLLALLKFGCYFSRESKREVGNMLKGLSN